MSHNYCRANGCEAWDVILSQWLWIIVWYTEPVVMHYCDLCWTSGSKSWCVMLRKWLWIMLCNAVIQNHWYSITHHESHPLAQHSSPWLTTTCSALHTMIHKSIVQDYTPWFTITCSGLHTMIYNHWFSITHDNSHPMAQYNIPCCTMLSQWLWIIVCYAEPVVLNHGV
jgi:hypothetical protein